MSNDWLSGLASFPIDPKAFNQASIPCRPARGAPVPAARDTFPAPAPPPTLAAIDSSTVDPNASFYFRQPRLKQSASRGGPAASEFRCASGASALTFTDDAAAEAAAQLRASLGPEDEPSLVVVHATCSHDVHALRAALRRLFPRALLHGGSSCGGVMSQHGALAAPGGAALALYAICDEGGLYASAYALAPDDSAGAAGGPHRQAGIIDHPS